MKKVTFIFTLSILAIMPINSQSFVKIDAHGANNGTSWYDAYVNLDSALIKTSEGEIWVAGGIYKPSVDINTPFKKYKTFNINKKIALYGGFSGIENNINQRDVNKNLTILSGDIGVAGNDADNTPIVVSITGSDIDSSTILDGFTITKAYYSNGYDSKSGAINIWCSGNPVVRNCIIKENFGYYGGGIYIRNCDAKIINNTISNNRAYQGAGIYNDNGADSKIINNRIINNQCTGGYTHLSGGGIQIEAYSAPYIYGNLVDNNYAGTCGGGISVETNYSAIISNNVISNNSGGTGGGIYINYTPTQIVNNLIISNQAEYGGGLYINYSDKTNSINNTIVNNYSKNAGSAVYLVDINMNFINTIIYNNTTPTKQPIKVNNSNRKDWFPKFKYCNIENGKNSIAVSESRLLDSLWKSGNISIYPDFIDTANCNYQLSKKSSCINVGIPDTTGLGIFKTDLLGTNRIQYNQIDIGCYELDSFSNNQFLSVTPRYFNLKGWIDSTFNISVTSNNKWFIRNSKDWIKLSLDSGLNNATVSIILDANPNLITSRTAQIFISGEKVTSQNIPITITQTESAYLTISKDSLFVASKGDNNLSFNINSNLNWFVSNFSNWLSLNKSSGSNSDKITINVLANNTSNVRIGTIKVYSYNGGKQISSLIIVVQQPNSNGINEINESDINLFPNPIINNLTILFSSPKYHTIVNIYSLNGSLLYSSEVNKNQIVIDMSSFDSGCYFLKIASPNDIKTYKLIKY